MKIAKKKGNKPEVAPMAAPVAADKNDKLPKRASKSAKVTTTDAPAVSASKYKGMTTGLRVMAFQDATFAANVTKMLTDEELAAAWRKEFPQAVAFTAFHVKGARRDYNAGRHAKATPKPAIPLAEVTMDGGKRRFVTAEAETPKAKAPKTVAPVTATAGRSKRAATPISAAA